MLSSPRPRSALLAAFETPSLILDGSRILPNHARATASRFDADDVIPADTGSPMARWPHSGGR